MIKTKNMIKVAILLFLLLSQANLQAYEIKVRVFLQGAVFGGAMQSSLHSELKKTYSQTPADVVDILTVELRSTINGAALESKQAFLLKDGTVVDFQNPILSNISFNLTGNSYYVVVKHRNHLPIASKNPVQHQQMIDLTNPGSVQGSFVEIQGKSAMIAGNVVDSSDDKGEVNASDFYVVSQAKDNNLKGLHVEDLNFDGIVNERDFEIVKLNSKKLYFSTIY